MLVVGEEAENASELVDQSELFELLLQFVVYVGMHEVVLQC